MKKFALLLMAAVTAVTLLGAPVVSAHCSEYHHGESSHSSHCHR